MMDTFMEKLRKHGICVSVPDDEHPNKKQKMSEEETAITVDAMEDVQTADTASRSISANIHMVEGGSPNAIDEPPKSSCRSFLELPSEIRQQIYEAHLSDSRTVSSLIYKHPISTNQSLSTIPTEQKRAAPTDDQTEAQTTKLVSGVIKTHPFILLKNKQITSEYTGAARKYIIHSLTLTVTNLPHLTKHWQFPITRSNLARLKLTLDFGRGTNDVEHARVRDHIVALVQTMPHLVDLQILYTHEIVRNEVTKEMVNDWQTVRYELVYPLLPLLRKAVGKRQRTVRIFPFVTRAGGWHRVQFP